MKSINFYKKKTEKSKNEKYKKYRIRTESNGFIGIKTLVIVVLIVAQFFIMAYLYFSLSSLFRIFYIFSIAVTLFTCVYALSSNKNSLSKAVWILFLLVSFGFGYVIYFLSDERIFFKKAKKKYEKIFDYASKYIKEGAVIVDDCKIKLESEYLRFAGNFTASKNNSLQYYPSGAIFFDNVLQSFANAKRFIFIEFFTISDGALLSCAYEILKEKSLSGVDVRIIFDDMGSLRTFSKKTKEKFLKANIKICAFNRLIPAFSVSLNYRDHRKIVVVDGLVAFTGGCNLADEYVNEKCVFGYWKDAGLKLRGECVDSFTIFFLRQWQFLTDEREDYSLFLNKFSTFENSAIVIPFVDGLDFDYDIGKSLYQSVISSANERVYIMTPYFVLDDTLAQIITTKSRSGVDVRIVLPSIPDKKYVYSVTRNNAEKLISSGVKVYCLKDSFTHAKLLLTEKTAVVGSINFDLRSFYQQFECGVITDDKAVLSNVFDDFTRAISCCQVITEENRYRNNFFYRVYSGFLQIFAPFM